MMTESGLKQELCFECGLPEHTHPGRLCDEFIQAMPEAPIDTVIIPGEHYRELLARISTLSSIGAKLEVQVRELEGVVRDMRNLIDGALDIGFFPTENAGSLVIQADVLLAPKVAPSEKLAEEVG